MTTTDAMLSQWIEENCVFLEGSSNNVLFVTKGETTKDAAGNVVNIRKQEGTEYKAMTESSAAVSKGVLRGLVTLQAEVTSAKEPEYVLILGLSQDSMDKAFAVKKALSQSPKGEGAPEVDGSAKKQSPEAESPANRQTPTSDKATPETKTNSEAKDFL